MQLMLITDRYTLFIQSVALPPMPPIQEKLGHIETTVSNHSVAHNTLCLSNNKSGYFRGDDIKQQPYFTLPPGINIECSKYQACNSTLGLGLFHSTTSFQKNEEAQSSPSYHTNIDYIDQCNKYIHRVNHFQFTVLSVSSCQQPI